MADHKASDRISPGFWTDKRFFASPEVLQENPRRLHVAGWHSLELIRLAGKNGLTYAEWQEGIPRDIKNMEGSAHKHLRWDYDRGNMDVVKDRGEGTPSPYSDVTEEVRRILADGTIPNETTRKALIEARLGQGRFRKDLDRRWNGRCAVTGLDQPEVLRASHMKAWARSSNQERLDPNNGLLLSANIDALFDRGLISFEPNGQMLVSELVSGGTIAYLGLPLPLREPLTEPERAFLAHHAQEVFR